MPAHSDYSAPGITGYGGSAGWWGASRPCVVTAQAIFAIGLLAAVAAIVLPLLLLRREIGDTPITDPVLALPLLALAAYVLLGWFVPASISALLWSAGTHPEGRRKLATRFHQSAIGGTLLGAAGLDVHLGGMNEAFGTLAVFVTPWLLALFLLSGARAWVIKRRGRRPTERDTRPNHPTEIA